MIKVSYCIPGTLPPEAGLVAQNPYERLLFGYQYLKSLGFDAVETSVGFVLALSDKERARLAEDYRAGRFSLEVCNCLLPSGYAIVTDEAGWNALFSYLEDALGKVASVGVKKVVFGSGRARTFPEGRDRNECETILFDYLTRCNALCERYGLTMTLEPLHYGETNWVNTLEQGAEVVRRLNLPHIRLLADGYHMAKVGEAPEAVLAVGDVLAHAHLAEGTKRHAPFTYDGEYETRFLRALKAIGYDGILACECGQVDFHRDAKHAVEAIKRILAE